MSAPLTRTLPVVLRRQLAREKLRLEIGRVASVPDALRVQVTIAGADVTIPRLSSYVPTVGEGVYCLAAQTLVLAVGAVGGVTGGQGEPGPAGPAPTLVDGTTTTLAPGTPASSDVRTVSADTYALDFGIPQGLQGATGAQGPKGDTGAQGTAGTPGEKWFTGSGAPAGATGIVGDWYLDSATGDYYEKTGASAWTLRGNLRGPQGIQGPQGPSGAGTFLSGSGAPTAGVGVDGAIYLDTASGRLWGPKAAGAWPAQPLGRIVPLQPTYAQLTAG